jgi:hypothetical protein
MKGSPMNYVFKIFVFSIFFSQVVLARECSNDDKIHNMLPGKTILTFNKAIDVSSDSGIQLSAGEQIPIWEQKDLGRSIRILTSDKSLRGSYAFVRIDVSKQATGSDDTPFIFEPLQGQYLEISLYQHRSNYDPRSEAYISVGSLKYQLKNYATLKAVCKDNEN